MGQYRMPHLQARYLMVASEADSYQIGKDIGHRPVTDAELDYAATFARRSHDKAMALLAPGTPGGSDHGGDGTSYVFVKAPAIFQSPAGCRRSFFHWRTHSRSCVFSDDELLHALDIAELRLYQHERGWLANRGCACGVRESLSRVATMRSAAFQSQHADPPGSTRLGTGGSGGLGPDGRPVAASCWVV